jgi:hypothetical protein
MSFNLWWAENDGMSGHVWLGAGELLALGGEMLVQGMAREGGREEAGDGIPLGELAPAGDGGGRVSADEVEQALAAAAPEPLTMSDARLWADWLSFLEGAARHGGIVIR